MVTQAGHDQPYAGILDTADALDRSFLADRVRVVRRGGQPVYTNVRTTDGGWRSPPATRRAIETERARVWTIPEAVDFSHTVRRLRQEMGSTWRSTLDAVSEQARPHLPAGTEAAMVARNNLSTSPAIVLAQANPPREFGRRPPSKLNLNKGTARE
ncbi:MAG: hypothetical protein ACRCTR_08145 [Actinomycetota bacterium]